MYDFFSDFFQNFDIVPSSAYVPQSDCQCPKCGKFYTDFRKTGKLGCAMCYETFKNPVLLTLRQIHPNPQHKGKIPSKCEGELKRKRLYEELKEKLSQAVKEENYEEAAKLHKQIRTMENEVK